MNSILLIRFGTSFINDKEVPIKRLFARFLCAIRGHDYGYEVYISPSMLTCCHRCGRDIQGRSIEDLEPMTDEDYEYLDQHIDMEFEND
jgi:hypothetical protein